MVTVRYDSPPIVEAVCEFRFAPEGAWDNAIPGLVYGRLKEEFPQRSPARRLQFKATHGAELSADFRVDEYVRLGLASAPEQVFVHLAPHHLSVHYLAPYAGWAKYRPLITKALSAYLEEAKPVGLRRVGLRYVNRLTDFPAGTELGECLRVYPELGPELPQSLNSFHLVVTTFAPGLAWPGTLLKLGVRSDDGATDRGVFLDIDCYNDATPPAADATITEWVDRAHEVVTAVFDQSLGTVLRERLGRRELREPAV